MKESIFIIDSGIFMNTNQIPELEGNIITSPLIIDELKSSKANLLFEMFSANTIINVEIPDKKSINTIIETADKIGQKGLSKPDIDILSLALQYQVIDSKNVVLISDDYALRNIAHELNIKSKSLQTDGGNQKRIYRYICKACNNKFDRSMEICDVCGFNKFERKRTH